jgi:predicted dehydrogenase
VTPDEPPIGIGVLGAARIAAEALVRPAARRPDARVVAVAARRPGAARTFADEHGISTASEDYERVIADERVGLVYIALAASDHARWAIAALEAGKHVLVEKPAAISADEAARMVRASGPARLVEAFHYRYHPAFRSVLDLVRSGTVGAVRSMTSEVFDSRPFDPASVMHDPRVGGGTLRHAGCYPVHWTRTLAGSEPSVVSARADLNPLGADETVEAVLGLPGGVEARLVASFGPTGRQGNRLVVRGERGRIEAENLIAPHAGHSISVHVDGEASRTFTVAGRTSYDHQLEAVLAALRSGSPLPTEGEDIVANAAALDAIAATAGIDGRAGDNRSG